MVKEQLPDISPDNILSEPVQLSTAPATVWASYHISLRDPKANILVTPCDQLISDEATFISEMEAGLAFVANHDAMLAMGVKAQCANSAYGYIQKAMKPAKISMPSSRLPRSLTSNMPKNLSTQASFFGIPDFIFGMPAPSCRPSTP